MIRWCVIVWCLCGWAMPAMAQCVGVIKSNDPARPQDIEVNLPPSTPSRTVARVTFDVTYQGQIPRHLFISDARRNVSAQTPVPEVKLLRDTEYSLRLADAVDEMAVTYIRCQIPRVPKPKPVPSKFFPGTYLEP